MARERRWGHEAMTDLERGIAIGFLAAIFWFSLGIAMIPLFVKKCLRPDLMRIIFVIAFLLSIVGFLKQTSVLSSTAFYSIVLFPFLDWLDISIRIPENTTSTLLYSIIQTIVLLIISFLIDIIL
jgi:hypothetical protein